jgi:2-aminoethylphosphonate dioxygenase
VVTGGQFKNNLLPQEDDKTIRRSVIRDLMWVPIECKAGTIVLFDSFLPHYSDPNHSNSSRRAVFMTYNRLSDSGSKREEYYSDKRLKFPPECEREPGIDYSMWAYIYNVANPIVNEVEV